MSAPLAPAELRELLGLLAELARFLPVPADDNWDRREQVQRGREILLFSRLEQLEIQLHAGDQYPSVGGKLLAEFCTRSAEVIRAKLAEPLGYKPEPDAAAGQRRLPGRRRGSGPGWSWRAGRA